MFQKYNDDGIVVKFIKELLRSTDIPIVQVWKPGKPLIMGFRYITKEYIVEAKVDYTPSMVEPGPQTPTDTRYFKIIKPYVEGMHYNGITTNYTSNSSTYDSETHEYFGNYLRWYRDLHDIDLMPYYNCWNGTYTDRLRINAGTMTKYTYTINDGKKVLIVPIKFNQKYTIYLNSTSPVEYAVAYYDGFNLLQSTVIETNVLKSGTINTCSVKHPYLFEGISQYGSAYMTVKNSKTSVDIHNILLEDYLTLFIQISELNTTPITILEGDYTDVQLLNVTYTGANSKKISIANSLKEVIYNEEVPSGKPYVDINVSDYCKFIPSITRASVSSAFSSRLVEYLLLNVISPTDEITQNIERIQTYVSSSKFKDRFGIRYEKSFTKGVWDTDLQKFIYDIITHVHKYPKSIDVNGLVDKDTEEILLRGK